MTIAEERGSALATERVAGKVAIVTGAGQVDGPGIGIGKATAMLLARHGASIVLVDRDPDRAHITLKEIEESGGTGVVAPGDVTNIESCSRMTGLAMSEYGRLDILVNNVGLATAGSVVSMSEDTWDEMVDVNLKSVFLVSKYAIPAMQQSGGGSIVNISSIAALRSIGFAAYSAAKGGMISLSQEMAVQHGPQGVRVNVVIPGTVQTPRTLRSTAEVGTNVEDMARRASASLPLGGLTRGTAWDIAYAVLYFASDESSWITGQFLTADGGASCVYPELAVASYEATMRRHEGGE